MKQVIELLFKILVMFLIIVALHGIALGDTESHKSQPTILMIGNSLTWDTRPSLLDGKVHWHVDCGKSLKFIRDNPAAPCVKSSSLWPEAMTQTQYDIICVQPHYGTTLKEDVAVISEWVSQQEKAVFIIHTGWAKHEFFENERTDTDPAGLLTHSNAYFNALLNQLRTNFPRRTFGCTRAMTFLFQISDDIKAGTAPFEHLSDLYRDAIHMKTDTGRYLMHNAVRIAFNQPISGTGLPKLTPNVQTYLDDLLQKRQRETHDHRVTPKDIE